MVNSFDNDHAHISTKWLLRLLSSRGLIIQHLLQIEHIGTQTSHVLAVLSDGRYACDCCMQMNLGLPCRHFFQAWTAFKGLKFHISLVRARYLLSISLQQWYAHVAGL